MPKYCQLANYLGTGEHPHLVLELSDNGPGWDPFTIDYQNIGNIPWSKERKKDWSAWNVKDSDGNYYGTITLHSNGQEVTWGNYVSGKNNCFLEGIHFVKNESTNTYQLTVDKIYSNEINPGPFPDAVKAQPAVYPGSNTPVTLHVSGNNIVNDKGAVIKLKGMVRPTLEWNKLGEKLSPEDIQNMKKWGINTLRINLNQNYWFESEAVTEKGSYKQIIDAMIYYASQQGMVVILDLHWTENGHQNSMANKKSIRFWKEVAEAYKNFGTVIFELFNEPVGIDKSVWLHGNSDYAGYQELYDEVRKTGAKNICIVNGLRYGYDLTFVNQDFRVEGYNIVYGSHPYNDSGDKQHLSQNLQHLLGKYPLIFTEFGVNNDKYFPNGYQQVYSNILEFAEENNINYTGFAWWVDSNPKKVNAFPDLISDWSGTPLNGGKIIWDDLQNSPVQPFYSSPSKRNGYYSSKRQQLTQKISEQIESLQKDATRKGVVYKILDFIAGLIPSLGIFSAIKQFFLGTMRKVLDIDEQKKNTDKIQTLQSLMQAKNAQQARNIINEAESINHHRNVFMRPLAAISPDRFQTTSRKLAEKLAAILPEDNAVVKEEEPSSSSQFPRYPDLKQPLWNLTDKQNLDYFLLPNSFFTDERGKHPGAGYDREAVELSMNNNS